MGWIVPTTVVSWLLFKTLRKRLNSNQAFAARIILVLLSLVIATILGVTVGEGLPKQSRLIDTVPLVGVTFEGHGGPYYVIEGYESPGGESYEYYAQTPGKLKLQWVWRYESTIGVSSNKAGSLLVYEVIPVAKHYLWYGLPIPTRSYTFEIPENSLLIAPSGAN